MLWIGMSVQAIVIGVLPSVPAWFNLSSCSYLVCSSREKKGQDLGCLHPLTAAFWQPHATYVTHGVGWMPLMGSLAGDVRQPEFIMEYWVLCASARVRLTSCTAHCSMRCCTQCAGGGNQPQPPACLSPRSSPAPLLKSAGGNPWLQRALDPVQLLFAWIFAFCSSFCALRADLAASPLILNKISCLF